MNLELIADVGISSGVRKDKPCNGAGFRNRGLPVRSEKRLARALLLARYGKDDQSHAGLPRFCKRRWPRWWKPRVLRTASNHDSVTSREALPQVAWFKRPTGQMLLIPAMVVCSSYFPPRDIYRRCVQEKLNSFTRHWPKGRERDHSTATESS